MDRVLDVDLRPCPLCRHSAAMELECEDGVHMFDRVRCCYCGCTYSIFWHKGSSHDENIKFLQDGWNKRAEYCQYCGEMVGAVVKCPHCGSSLLAQS